MTSTFEYYVMPGNVISFDECSKAEASKALHLLRRGWEQVTETTIKNCFHHAKFIHNGTSNEEEGEGGLPDNAMNEFLNAWTDLQQLGGIDADAATQDFINVDDLVITCGVLTLAEIVDDVTELDAEGAGEVNDNELMDVEEVEVEKPPISQLEAQRAFAIARQYVEENTSDPAVLRLTDKLDEYFYKEGRKKQTQPRITSFFSASR